MQRNEDVDDFVFLAPFDAPDHLVEANFKLLESSGCRLALDIRNSQPIRRSEREVYRCSMSHAMLLTFLRSLSAGELLLLGGVTIAEAITTFEYEGLRLSSNMPTANSATVARSGAAFQKLRESGKDTARRLCTAFCDALMQWPRLAFSLEHAFSGTRAPVTSPSPRAWVRFVPRPKLVVLDGAAVTITNLVASSPRWLLETMTAIGFTHSRLARERPEMKAARTPDALKTLVAYIEADALGVLFFTRADACREDSNLQTRTDLRRGERYCHEMRHSILQSAASPEKANEVTVYARAVVTYASSMMHRLASYDRVFSGACSSSDGTTPERRLLAKLLKARGVAVVRWLEDKETAGKPLAFPPMWRDGSAVGPAVLLSFENMHTS